MILDYYPFGLKHKGYNNQVSANANQVASKFKYNSSELEEGLGVNLYEMDLRQYDPTIARWTAIDPVVHYAFSTYSAFDNDPIYWADPSGADGIVNWGNQEEAGAIAIAELDHQYGSNHSTTNNQNNGPDDIITVGSNGKVTDVKKDEHHNVFFDESGNRLNFHDEEGLDNPILFKDFNIGDVVYKLIEDTELNNEITRLISIFYGEGMHPLEEAYFNLRYADESYYSYDFTHSFIKPKFKIKTEILSELYYGKGFHTDAPFIKFQQSNTLYNLPDAGNFIWGLKAFHNQLTPTKVKQISTVFGLHRDDSADQQAIESGFNYKLKN